MFIIFCVGLLLTLIAEVELSQEVAQGKAANSSTIFQYQGFSFLPSLAVDGNTTNNIICHSCLITSPGAGVTEAYFTIYLNGTYSINSVEIYYREDYNSYICPAAKSNRNQTNYRFKGYSIHISSTPNWRIGTTCYRDRTEPYPNLHVNNTCIGTGSYITIYNNNTDPSGGETVPVLELCEVKVYGCKLGYFGSSCSLSCSNCKDDLCDPDTGICRGHCKDGWLGDKCDRPCNFGFYGNQCSRKCGHCSNNVTCDNVNGVCKDGCRTGFRGELCLNECLDGSYGINCFKICGNCQGELNCRKEDGKCPDGCLTGWEGLTCLERSSEKTYVVVTICLSVVCSVFVLAAFVVIILCLRRRGSCPGRQNNKNNDSIENPYELSINQRQNEHHYDHITNQ